MSTGVPLTGFGATLYARGDRELPPVPQREGAPSNAITPGWLRSWGVALLAGRDFNEHDIADRPNVVLISKSGARKVFGDEDPIGKTLVVTSLSVPCEIVGIVGDVRSEQLARPNPMEFYRPLAQENFPFASITVRSTLKPDVVTRLVQSAMKTIDPGIALIQPQPMDNLVMQSLGQARLMMILLGVFAVVALVLATVGIYGAVAYTVEQRTGEIGVRMALGAQTADVLRLVLKQGMTPVVFGLVVGILAALAVGRLTDDDVARSVAARSAPAWRNGCDPRARGAAGVSLSGTESDAAESRAGVARRVVGGFANGRIFSPPRQISPIDSL